MLNRIVLLIILMLPAAAFSADTPAEIMKGKTRAVIAENKDLSKDVQLSKKLSQQEIKALKSEVKKLDRRYNALRNRFEQLLDAEKRLTEELEDKKDEIKAIEGAVRASAKEADEMIHSNPITAAMPERIGVVQQLLDNKKFPGIDSIKELFGIYFDEMHAGSSVSHYSGEIIASDGSRQQSDIIRLGRFVTYSSKDGIYGLLKTNEQGDKLISVTEKLPSEAVKAIESGFTMPLDFSGGVMFKKAADGKSLTSVIKAGGMLVYPILGIGLIAFLIILERLITLGRIKNTSDKRMDTIMGFAEKNDWEGCDRYCDDNMQFPTCRVLKSTMTYIGETQEVIENAMQEAILKELPRMERFLPTLNVLAAVAPLLGLLGTVTGMINTFNILTIFGTGDPRMMSGGISEALVTTQLGLAVAIPVMLCHHMLERRVDKILGEIEEKGTRFSVALLKKDTVRG